MEHDFFRIRYPKIDEANYSDNVPLEFNISKNLISVGQNSDISELNVVSSEEYEQFLADVWVGIVLTLMVLSCVCFMCSCLIYHKFQQWKNRVLQSRTTSNIENGSDPVNDLPSYTVASGLPSYEEALEQMKKAKPNLPKSSQLQQAHTQRRKSDSTEWIPRTPPTPPPPHTASHTAASNNSINSIATTTTATLSVSSLFPLMKNDEPSRKHFLTTKYS